MISILISRVRSAFRQIFHVTCESSKEISKPVAVGAHRDAPSWPVEGSVSAKDFQGFTNIPARAETGGYEVFWRRVKAGPYWLRITGSVEHDHLRDEVRQLVRTHRGKTTEGFVLVAREHALEFLSGLESLGIAVMGCDHYYYVPYRGEPPALANGGLLEVEGRKYVTYPGIRVSQTGSPEGLCEALDGGFYVGDEVLLLEDPTVPGIRKTREHILNNLPPDTEFLEIGLVIPDGWLGHTLPQV